MMRDVMHARKPADVVNSVENKYLRLDVLLIITYKVYEHGMPLKCAPVAPVPYVETG